MMLDVPYTTPDEDPFCARPPPQPLPRTRRSSLLDRWIQDQRSHAATPTHDIATLGYDLIDDDDIPAPASERDTNNKTPATPTNPRLSRRASKLLLNLSLRASPPSTVPSEGDSSRHLRFSFLPRSPRTSSDSPNAPNSHTRSASLSTLTTHTPRDAPKRTSSPKWRPSVLGHFSTSQASVIPLDNAQPRPSLSSADTYTSGTPTTVESELLQTPSNLTLMDPTRSPSSIFHSKPGTASSSTLWSQKHTKSCSSPAISGGKITLSPILSPKAPCLRIPLAQVSTTQLPNTFSDEQPDDDDDDDCDCSTHEERQRGPDQPQVAYSAGGTLRRVKFASLTSRHRKKKKLVVTGVGFNDTKKFEGVKRWCESFGEVSQIVRMPNGDLHIHFRLAEVADTVCRLRAKVFITGVGSVQLSWFTGEKR